MTAPGCYLNALGLLCSSGASTAAVKQTLCSGQPKLSLSSDYLFGRQLPLGIVQGELPSIPLSDRQWHSRNNQFTLAALGQIQDSVDAARARFGADRVGVIVGTSTSGIAESESAIRQWLRQQATPVDYDYALQEMGAPAQFIAEYLELSGPCYSISTACSSGAKALASARRLLRARLCDAVIAGGVDTLCRLTVQGFSSLEAVSDERCNPMSKNRRGINIGEGAALFLVSGDAQGVELCGVGEGSDAYHISAPEPTGAGAIRCMTTALADAGVDPAEVGYVNLHGTATLLNDQMESRAIERVFGLDTACSSTKPFTGHTLGAAGALEAGICWLTLASPQADFLPPHVWDRVADPELPAISLVATQAAVDPGLRYVLSNTFAFGGNNIALLLGRVQ